MNALVDDRSDVWRDLREAGTPDVFFAAWLRCLAGTAGFLPSVTESILVWADLPNSGPFHPVACWPEAVSPDGELAALCERALDLRLIVQKAIPTGTLWAAPILLGADLLGVVALRCPGKLPERLEQWLHWGSGWLAEHMQRVAQAGDATVRDRLLVSLELLTRLFEGDSAQEAAQAVVTEIAQRLACERVSIGLGDAQSIRLFALSHSADFSRRLDLVNVIEQAMAEAADQGETICLREAEASPTGNLLMVREHRRLQRDFDSRIVLSVPFTQGESCGVFLFEWAVDPEPDGALALAQGLAPLLGRALADYRRLTRPWRQRLRDGVREQWRKLIGPQEGRRKLLVGSAVLLLLFLVFADGRFKVAAPSRLEGGIRRVIVAPFDGFVATSAFRAGQLVEAGGVLATLDDRELRLEGSRWDSQQYQYAKQAQDAQAQHNLAQLQISLAQTRQAEAQRELTRTLLERSQIKAPFAGIIVAGDLSQQLGAAVKKGQTLYEIAPLDSYRVILDVEEVDVPNVQAGQQGELIVAALPAERFPFTVTLVTPVASAREGKNYFRVEANVDQPNARLRPGMEGVAKVEIGQRALVWIWTHRFFDWCRLQAWVWLGI